MARVPQLDDKAELLGFTAACEAMALQASEREQLLQCMAGLLHLGNIEFDDGSGDATGPAVAIAARSSLPNISEISGDGGGGGAGGGGGGGGLAPRAAVRADCAAALREAARHLGIEQACWLVITPN